MDLSPFVAVRAQAEQNVKKNYDRIAELCGPNVPRRAKLLHSVSYYPRMLENCFVAHYDNIPDINGPAPIYCFAHKKIQDVMALVQYMVGRDVDRFHNVTLVAQGGLFHGIFPYQDIVPGFLKSKYLGWPLGIGTRIMARFFRGLFRDLNAYPVYRDGADVPRSEEAYKHPSFAGPHVTGMSYQDFQKYTRKQTAKSVLQVQKDMDEKNRSFVILPEGRYCHDGRISELLDLAAYASHRKSRPIVYISLSYDELCPDALGKIDAFLYTNEPMEPPRSREDFKPFMSRGRQLLQSSTTITASGLLAAATIIELQESKTISKANVQKRFEALCDAILKADYIVDPRLGDPEFRKDRFGRFLSRRASRWFSMSGDSMTVRPRRIMEYDSGERTVPDILWNINNIIHVAPVLGLDIDLSPEALAEKVGPQ
ncbi:MAG: hypothetical protein KDK23_16975 [Leptospiraceae bacterium]|nr:hypothetical protein [Leptospiraceae bacterium]